MAIDILSLIFNKKGIKSVDELSKEEKATFEQYERVLSKKELSIDDIRNFLKSQLEIIEGRWRDLGMTSFAKAELLPLHTAYKTLLTAIDAPMLEREQLETYLRGLVDND